MKFSVNQEIFAKWPEVKIGVLVLTGVKNGKNEEILNLLRQQETEGKTALEGKDFNLMPEVAVWKEVYRAFGSNPREYRSSVEALLRRVRSGSQLPSINSLVDLYNYLSIKHHVPAGAEDLDKVQGDIELSFAKGTETGKYIGDDEVDTCYEGEVIYKDNIGFICRRWNWREADRTKIEESTQNAVLVFEAMPPAQINGVLEEAKTLINKYLGGNQQEFILSKDNPTLETDFRTGSKVAKEEVTVSKKVKSIKPAIKVEKKRELPPKELISYKIIQDIYKVIKNIYPEVGINPEDIHVEHPVEETFGDYSTNIAMRLSKDLKKNPLDIADEIAKNLQADFLQKAEAAKPGFINLKLKTDYLINQLNDVLDKKEGFGYLNWGNGQKWLIEHTSANPNKAMHLGHLRNNTTGMAIANIWEFSGIDVIRDCIDNNRGIAIAKLMWGYLKFARKDKKINTDINYWFENQNEWQTPKDRGERPDRFVDELYTLASMDFEKDKDVEQKVRQLVVDWENENEKNWELWKKVLSYSYEGQEMTMQRLGNKWDKVWHEHEHYKMGKEMVDKGLKLGIFKKETNAIISDLSNYNLPDTVIIKSDGTALYITQDLALTKLKKEKFKPNKIFWVIGPEQSLALKQMFAVCEQLGVGKATDYNHIAFGYMSIKGKGKMSSRLGNVVYIDDLLDEAKIRIRNIMQNAQYGKILSGDQNAIDTAAEILAIGAVKYSILKVGRMQDIAFDFEESLSFEGNSGPYLQYTYARCKSVLSKNEKMLKQVQHDIRLEPEELAILRTLYKFPEVVLAAAQNYAPNLICNYLFDLAQKFNYFYDKLPILKADQKSREVRLKITEASAQVIKNGLKLLGIEAPEKM